jgi:succinyl-CoA synthetase alpha subunit
MEAADAGIKVIIAITEGIPVGYDQSKWLLKKETQD